MRHTKAIAITLLVFLLVGLLALHAMATSGGAEIDAAAVTESASAITVSGKAIASGIAIGIAAAGGAIGMGMAIGKSAEGVARQPEAEGKIRTTLMLGLVFIETAIIYALLAVILIIFVL